MRKCTQAGLRAARERGRCGGRKKKPEGKTLDLVRALWSNPEFTVEDIAEQVKVSRRTLFRELGARPIQAPSS
ncbi:helix-turn-helix domain-containing protein [Azospirillum largimobile]